MMQSKRFPNSSLIEEIFYDMSEQSDCQLHIRFKTSMDKVYVYAGVPASTAMAMEDASSAGEFFNAEIKSQYEHSETITDESVIASLLKKLDMSNVTFNSTSSLAGSLAF